MKKLMILSWLITSLSIYVAACEDSDICKEASLISHATISNNDRFEEIRLQVNPSISKIYKHDKVRDDYSGRIDRLSYHGTEGHGIHVTSQNFQKAKRIAQAWQEVEHCVLK